MKYFLFYFLVAATMAGVHAASIRNIDYDLASEAMTLPTWEYDPLFRITQRAESEVARATARVMLEVLRKRAVLVTHSIVGMELKDYYLALVYTGTLFINYRSLSLPTPRFPVTRLEALSKILDDMIAPFNTLLCQPVDISIAIQCKKDIVAAKRAWIDEVTAIQRDYGDALVLTPLVPAEIETMIAEHNPAIHNPLRLKHEEESDDMRVSRTMYTIPLDYKMYWRPWYRNLCRPNFTTHLATLSWADEASSWVNFLFSPLTSMGPFVEFM